MKIQAKAIEKNSFLMVVMGKKIMRYRESLYFFRKKNVQLLLDLKLTSGVIVSLQSNERGFTMDYMKLGNTGMDVSRICLGAMSFGDPNSWIHKWVLEEEESRKIIKRALDLGINFFDTANVYSIGRSEEILGRALKDYANRDEIVLATKIHGRMHEGPNGAGLSRKAILSFRSMFR